MDGHQPVGLRLDFAQQSKKKLTLIVLANIVVVGIIILILASVKSDEPKISTREVTTVISSFKQCADAGYPVQESYPARCSVPNGGTFTQEVAQVTQPKTTTPAQPTTPAQTKYQSKVGKFNLTLADTYVVIKDLDGQGERGSSARLSIGTKTTSSGVVEVPSLTEITIYATPAANGYSYNEFVTGRLTSFETSNTKVSSITVDSVKTDTYNTEGLVTSVCMFWEKQNIYYNICGPLDGLTPTKQLKDVIAGFKHV